MCEYAPMRQIAPAAPAAPAAAAAAAAGAAASCPTNVRTQTRACVQRRACTDARSGEIFQIRIFLPLPPPPRLLFSLDQVCMYVCRRLAGWLGCSCRWLEVV